MFRSSILINYVCMSVFVFNFFFVLSFRFLFIFLFFTLMFTKSYEKVRCVVVRCIEILFFTQTETHTHTLATATNKSETSGLKRKRREILRSWFRIFRNPRQFLGIVGFDVRCCCCRFYFIVLLLDFCSVVIAIVIVVDDDVVPALILGSLFFLFYEPSLVLTGLIFVLYAFPNSQYDCMMQVAARCSRFFVCVFFWFETKSE